MRLLLLFSVCVLWPCSQVYGYFVSVDAHAEECFFDRVSSGMKMSLTFEVVDGGFLDIDVKVRSSTSPMGESGVNRSLQTPRRQDVGLVNHMVCFNWSDRPQTHVHVIYMCARNMSLLKSYTYTS